MKSRQSSLRKENRKNKIADSSETGSIQKLQGFFYLNFCCFNSNHMRLMMVVKLIFGFKKRKENNERTSSLK